MSACEFRVVARNTARSSENRIHEDTVARQYGFRRGLVPGVTTIAYLMEAGWQAFNEEFLARGVGSVRLVRPVYDGDLVTVRTERLADGRLDARAFGPANETVAEGWLGLSDAPPPSPAEFPEAPLPSAEERPLASAAAFRARPMLGVLRARFDADEAWRYLAEVGLAPSGAGLRHPGLFIRYANWVLSSNVRLGPWVHVSSDFWVFGAPAPGATFETRAKVLDVFERKGHHFVQLDVLLVEGGRPLLRVGHTAIYELRPPSQG
uniref:Hypothetical conserved protein n=1 Tax=uncultured prokaryote TaxID=198431 RepID=H5SPM8_9ZZZZ|nr:hypothetical conserved protein [uncultured prokaryote]